MLVDILIAVFSALTTAIMAGLGVYVTLHSTRSPKKKLFYKLVFIVCGIIACALIGWQSYRNAEAQKSLNDTLSRIERNTLTPPPPPVVNVYPASPLAPLPLLGKRGNSLKNRANKLARELEGFEKMRAKGFPGVTVTNKMSPEEQQAILAPYQTHEQETYELYSKQFAPQVVALVQEFKAKGLDVSAIENCAPVGNCGAIPLPTALRALALRVDDSDEVKR